MWFSYARPRGQQVAIVVGITAFGFAFAVGLLYVWHVLRAPYRQRDEARQWVRDLRAESDPPSYSQAKACVEDALCKGDALLSQLNASDREGASRLFPALLPWDEDVRAVLRRYSHNKLLQRSVR